jgi:hypothetical protein
MIEEEGLTLAGHTNLMSVKGIGSVSAALRLSVIGNSEDFADGASSLPIGPGAEVHLPTKPNTPGASPTGQQTCAHFLRCSARAFAKRYIPFL